MQRPTGVTILAILEFIVGLLGLLGGCGAIGLGGLAGIGTSSAVAGIVGVGIGVALIVLSAIGLFIGYGLWTMKKWAWNAARILAFISIAFALLAIVGGAMAGQDLSSLIFGNIVGIAANAFIVYYLNKPQVKAVFA